MHLISITMETQIPCSTPEKRTVTFEELDLEIHHNKVEKKEEKKKKIIWCTEQGDKNLSFSFYNRTRIRGIVRYTQLSFLRISS